MESHALIGMRGKVITVGGLCLLFGGTSALAHTARPDTWQRPSTLTTPAWDWDPPHDEVCLKVPDVLGINGTNWTENSRGLFIALPVGTPPVDGWPVLLDLTIFDFLTKDPCGTEGKTPPALYPHEPPVPTGCIDAVEELCGPQLNSSTGTYDECEECVQRESATLHSSGCSNMSLAQVVGPPKAGWRVPLCPQPAPLATECKGGLSRQCPLQHMVAYNDCIECVDNAFLTNQSGCNRSLSDARALYCAAYTKPGFTMTLSPFASPNATGMACSCFNGSEYDCPPPVNGHHARGSGCDIDVFAGGMWWQRTKQFAVANGIAVVVVNAYLLDGWESYPEEWDGGYDPPFFAAFEAAIGNPSSTSALRVLNPRQIIVHGWSGGAQMVSWVIQLYASKLLGRLRIVGGIMSAGGTYACYYEPPLSRGQCSNCTPGGSSFGALLPCSNVTKAAGQEPLCNYCCPERFTEQWYADHPDEYATHPWTFLFQTRQDSGADSCAGAYYHDEMLRHGAHSEFLHVPMENENCYTIGVPGDPAVPAGDTFARFCSNPNVSSINHTKGFASMVEPATNFMLSAFESHADSSTYT